MSNIKGKIYHDKITGNIITRVLEQRNAFNVRESTVDEDFESLAALQERVRETVGVIILEIGQYAQDFTDGRLIGVNVETKTPIFEYPNLEEPDEPIVPEKPLSVEITDLKQENKLLKAQTQANADRADFQEELIVELAMKIYD